jgi:tetratricopeptide (TPR) repeat protein
LDLQPDYALADNNLGHVFLQQGDVDTAISYFQKTLESHPNLVLATYNLAWVLATCPQTSLRNGAKALELSQRARIEFCGCGCG